LSEEPNSIIHYYYYR